MKRLMTLLFVGLCLGAVWLAVIAPIAFFSSYLVSFLFFLSLALGAQAMLYVHALTGGHWGDEMQISLERLGESIYPLTLFSLPLIAAVSRVYPWATTGRSHYPQDVLQYYLTLPFFSARLVLYFIIWCTCYAVFRRRRREARRREGVAALGLLLVTVSVGFASLDWVSSLTSGWGSTVSGLYFAASFALAGFGGAVLLHYGNNRQPDKEGWSQAKILVTLIVLVLYLNYSQYIVMWSGNITDEVQWYVPRTLTSWKYVAALLLVLHYFFPFVTLLFQGWKKAALLLGASAVVLAQFIYLCWLVLPSFYSNGLHLPAALLVTTPALGAVFFWSLHHSHHSYLLCEKGNVTP